MREETPSDPAGAEAGGSPPASLTDAQLAAIVSLAADAIISVDQDQRITAFNQGAERIFGFEAAEVIGRPLDLLLPDRFRKPHREHIRAFADAPDTARRMGERLEIAGRRKSGEEFPADASISKLRTDEGWHFLAIVRDRSEERSQERALARAQSIARLGSWEWEAVTDELTWSDELYRIYGLRPGSEELTLEAFIERVHPEDRESTRAHIERAMQTLEPFAFEERIVRPDGTVRLLRSEGEVVADDQGRPLRLLGVCQDITEQREAEERALRLAGAEAAHQEALRLAGRLERLQAVTSALSKARTPVEVARVVIDQGLDVLEADRGAVAILVEGGEMAEALAVRGYAEFLVNRFRRVPITLPVPPFEALRTGEPVWIHSPDEYRERYPGAFAELYRLTGTKAMAALPFHTDEGLIGGMLAGFSSPNALGVLDEAFTLLLAQQTGEALARALAYEREREGRLDAEAATRAREETLAAVAHDLRTPLQVIESYIQLLAEDPDEARRARAVEMIRRGTAHMDRLVSDLLDAARIEAGTFTVEPLEVPVAPLIRDTLESYHALAEEKDITVTVVAAEEAGHVRADPERLVQVLGNLVTNSIKFCDPGCDVTVEVSAEGDEILFMVRDTGPGIPPEEQAHLFERYWQGRRRGDHSAGLGLTISKAIVEAHGGRIWIESEVGEGTAVWFTMPAAGQPAVAGA